MQIQKQQIKSLLTPVESLQSGYYRSVYRLVLLLINKLSMK